MNRTAFFETCCCVRLIGGCKKMPLVAHLFRLSSPRVVVGHGACRSYISFVISRFRGTSRLLPRGFTNRGFKQMAGKTTLTVGSHVLLCTTDPL